MDTLLTNIKTVLTDSRDNAGTLSYMPQKSIIKTAPNSLPPLRNDQFPFIGIAPRGTSEDWITSGKREVVHLVELYAARYYAIEEDSVERAVEHVVNVMSVVRNQKFSDYLSAPATIVGTNYITTPYGDNITLIVATITIECRKIFISSVP